MELIHFNSVVFFQLLLLSFCLVFEFFSINCNALGQCLQTESSALLQLKRGFTSGDLDTWQLGTNCCIWEGVTCDESSGRVIGLDLSNRFIVGMIDPSLFNLTSLRALNFANNQFHGDLEFEFIKDLKNLTSLDLSNGGLSLNSWDAYNGNFLSSFPKISYLAVASCNLTKIPPIINYSHMMGYLDLSNNIINGEIPSWIWRIPKLNLSCNMFTHVADSPLNVDTYYYNYSFIDLHSNMLESQILPLPLTNHKLLDFSNNRFTSFISFNISSHQNSLQYLFLANNSMTGEIPPFICNMTKLVVLDLSNNKLTGSIPSCLLKGVDLQLLKIRGNQLHGAIPNEISPKCELQIIDLKNNQLDELIPRSLSNCKSLEILDLGINNLKDTFPYWFGNSCCS